MSLLSPTSLVSTSELLAAATMQLATVRGHAQKQLLHSTALPVEMSQTADGMTVRVSIKAVEIEQLNTIHMPDTDVRDAEMMQTIARDLSWHELTLLRQMDATIATGTTEWEYAVVKLEASVLITLAVRIN